MRQQYGFTLVEMMLVVTLCAMLLALAVPSYQSHLVRTRRVEGMVALLITMQQQERYFAQNNRYSVFSSASTEAQQTRFKWWSGDSASASAYELAARPCADASLVECVELIAMPGTDKIGRHIADPECATLVLSSTGRRSATGPSAHCWP